jgi:hypothetical protein
VEIASNPGPAALAVTATSSSINGYIDYMNISFTPYQVTQVYNANGACGCVLNNHAVALWQSQVPSQWTVYNVDIAPMPVGVEFFVRD